MTTLSTTKPLDIRFSEVDSMNIVWHGSYALYLEDAREAFGAEYELGYMDIFGSGHFAPIVDLQIQYKHPIRYGMQPFIEITYEATEAAKLVFRYRIYNPTDGLVLATGRSVQVFMDLNYQLLWEKPAFFLEWQRKWSVL